VTDIDVAAMAEPQVRPGPLIGYARCSTFAQDTEIHPAVLAGYGVPADRVYVDEGFTRTSAGPAWTRPSHRLQLDRDGKKTPD